MNFAISFSGFFFKVLTASFMSTWLMNYECKGSSTAAPELTATWLQSLTFAFNIQQGVGAHADWQRAASGGSAWGSAHLSAQHRSQSALSTGCARGRALRSPCASDLACHKGGLLVWGKSFSP